MSKDNREHIREVIVELDNARQRMITSVSNGLEFPMALKTFQEKSSALIELLKKETEDE